ncbi:response regulator [Azotosporobacter soli]|jgi:two-component system, chemotaxis family, chemotaxis protein CheY|uniref:response regulator n=1 Tax=Azotosporobacter soli TaxID=3055040 RepID=UPI0031FF0083
MAKILVCDDSAFMRMMLKKVLIEQGHEIVGEAGDGMEAVAQYEKLQPELVTMDITMPKMDGIEAVRRIHELNPVARIVMVTALGQKAIITDALRAGAADFIVKPFDPEKVASIVKKVLDLDAV